MDCSVRDERISATLRSRSSASLRTYIKSPSAHDAKDANRAWDEFCESRERFATDATHGSVFHFAFTGATTLADNGGVSLANETATRDPRCIGYYYGDRLVDGFE